ncbi:Uncharacterized protein dnl_13410 [Desulfonema limicola]|uniref:Uncharacterized protein n=1 Tax=Desulfonema limicola TaxID=45656 RepID=A0A975B5F6_9BACT|nr:Uncharacterized protein dnl_13410 [Desulfonema limicola]
MLFKTGYFVQYYESLTSKPYFYLTVCNTLSYFLWKIGAVCKKRAKKKDCSDLC